jgi:hypothetical protein
MDSFNKYENFEFEGSLAARTKTFGPFVASRIFSKTYLQRIACWSCYAVTPSHQNLYGRGRPAKESLVNLVLAEIGAAGRRIRSIAVVRQGQMK